jgi:hypothetical protein
MYLEGSRKLKERSFLNSKSLIRVDSTGSYYKMRKTSKLLFGVFCFFLLCKAKYSLE